MSQDEITLVCEGVPRGRDLRWLNLVLGQLAESFELAGRVRVVPGGSKSDLSATVRGMREALGTGSVYAIRDRDFLRSDLVKKDEPAGVYSLERHCLESYLIEPEVLDAVFGLNATEEMLLEMADRRFWPDVGTAVLDTLGYELRKDRPHLEDELPANKEEATQIVSSKLKSFRDGHAAKVLDIEGLIDLFEGDMRSAPVWTRVNGKELMKSLTGKIAASGLPSRDIEAELFKWCSKNGPPLPFVAEMKRVLERLP